MNVPQLAEEAINRLGERMSLDFEGEQFTNVQLLDWDKRIHKGLSRLGMRRNEMAALCMSNHPLTHPVFGGIFRTGGIAVPVMFMMRAHELRYVLTDSGARGVVTDEANIEKVREAVKDLHHVQWILVRGGSEDTRASPPEYPLESFLDEEPEETLPEIDDQDVAMMLYTSGTTGNPKGVMLTHANLIAQAKAGIEAAELDTWEGPHISISALPMAHVFGVGLMMAGYLLPLVSTATMFRWLGSSRRGSCSLSNNTAAR